MRTSHGAWWATELATLPRTKRAAEVRPDGAHDDAVGAEVGGRLEQHVGRAAGDGLHGRRSWRRPRWRASWPRRASSSAWHAVGEHPLELVGRAGLVDELVAVRLVGGDDDEPGAVVDRQAGRLAHGPLRRRRPVRPDDHVLVRHDPELLHAVDAEDAPWRRRAATEPSRGSSSGTGTRPAGGAGSWRRRRWSSAASTTSSSSSSSSSSAAAMRSFRIVSRSASTSSGSTTSSSSSSSSLSPALRGLGGASAVVLFVLFLVVDDYVVDDLVDELVIDQVVVFLDDRRLRRAPLRRARGRLRRLRTPRLPQRDRRRRRASCRAPGGGRRAPG